MTTDNINEKNSIKNDTTTIIDEDVNSKSHITVKKQPVFPSEDEHKAKIQEKNTQKKKRLKNNNKQ